MLLQAAANYPVETYVLENDENAPAAHLCHRFVKGDIRNFDDVYQFGKGLDALTIERGIRAANESPRRRIIMQLHRSDTEGVQRMLNFMQRGSYAEEGSYQCSVCSAIAERFMHQ